MAELIQFRDHDCWRTWFFDECENAALFGVNKKHLGLITLHGSGVTPYHIGTEVFLEDAPVFKAAQLKFHRVCGPYEVTIARAIPEHATVVHEDHGRPILYLDPHPERGPWGNGTRVRRGVCGLDLKYRQTAREFNYYPYRFQIKRSPRWEEFVVPHSRNCELRDD